uniref:Uncharacterized protein LOC105039917 n=1 Tax=Elaeis guineensis var. tenera TaxID=51953 RepID=A0A6I9QST7_ELAGV|nr:uncharacterized protein LOC105039917 [Elaeis guineensis]
MLRRLVGFKASPPGLSSSGRRRGVSEVASNFPFANGREGSKTRSSSEMHDMRPWRNLHTAMSSTYQSASPKHEVEVAENLKPSPPNSIGDADAFAELGPSISESDDLSFGLTKQMHESVESKERALGAERITVKNCHLPVRGVRSLKIQGAQSPENVAVRITNIRIEITEPAIHSICMSCGHVLGLARTEEGAVDVMFRVKDSSTAQTIVKRLNDVCLDHCQWSAQLLPEFGQNLRSKLSDSQWSTGSQISNFIGASQKHLRMKQIYLEDLEELHHAILHLRDKPVDMNS